MLFCGESYAAIDMNLLLCYFRTCFYVEERKMTFKPRRRYARRAREPPRELKVSTASSLFLFNTDLELGRF
jgi:hypothetical protein